MSRPLALMFLLVKCIPAKDPSIIAAQHELDLASCYAESTSYAEYAACADKADAKAGVKRVQ